ncbi:hypothetical protein CJO94_05925 [Ralstonia solanacearum]|nr:hypothetical protein CJO94_05925 [Ralstonia solanacearum]
MQRITEKTVQLIRHAATIRPWSWKLLMMSYWLGLRCSLEALKIALFRSCKSVHIVRIKP